MQLLTGDRCHCESRPLAIAAQSEAIDAQAEGIRAMAQEMKARWKETARLGREVAEGQRWMQGRMRLLGERFDNILGAVERDYSQDHDPLLDLRTRVERLEQDRPPAA